jgi:hypothetical protein
LRVESRYGLATPMPKFRRIVHAGTCCGNGIRAILPVPGWADCHPFSSIAFDATFADDRQSPVANRIEGEIWD